MDFLKIDVLFQIADAIVSNVAFVPMFNQSAPCTGVPRLNGARDKKQVWRPPCPNLKSFRSKRTVFKKVFATLLGRFGARDIVPLVTPLAPCTTSSLLRCRWVAAQRPASYHRAVFLSTTITVSTS